jgi:hypothetical protein
VTPPWSSKAIVGVVSPTGAAPSSSASTQEVPGRSIVASRLVMSQPARRTTATTRAIERFIGLRIATGASRSLSRAAPRLGMGVGARQE